jgi:hypothetical protein
MYFCGVVVYPTVGALVKPPSHPDPDLLPFLPLLPKVLLAAALVVYVGSLWVEKEMLCRARRRRAPLEASYAALVVSACGEAISVFGLMLSLSGTGSWSPIFYGLCLAHGVHLALRWSSYQEIASDTGNESEESPAEEV